MKEVAGMLRLTLAKYRELAAFSQFASDLDESTKRQLADGARMVELLKQPQYSPLPAEQQVILLLSGNEGLLREVPVARIGAFAKSVLEHFKSRKPELLAEIVEKQTLKKDGLKDRIVAEVKAFLQTFAA
jgi:F-type H+-transporting ATPase subunit alpha